MAERTEDMTVKQFRKKVDIARKYGIRLAVLSPYARRTAPHGVVIHRGQVIVHERVAVQKLDSTGRI